MDQLRDSSGDLGDWSTLRSRIRDDGYVFVRGLLDEHLVRDIGRQCMAALQKAGWTERRADPVDAAPVAPVRATSVRDAFRDRGYRRVVVNEGFNRLPYLPPFNDVMRQIMGPNAFCYPLKLARVVYPTTFVPQQPGGIVHKDYSAVQDMFTTWVPLVDIPSSLGGLAVRAGSQRHAGFVPRPMDGREPGWATTDYRPGDVLVFHCLTTHAALPNHGDRLRLSAEYRWQLTDDPVPERMVRGRRGREIGARLFGRKPWWHPVPANLQYRTGGLDLRERQDRRQWPPAPSRFVTFTVP